MELLSCSDLSLWLNRHCLSIVCGRGFAFPLNTLTINELSNVPVPVMLMPDDFKAYSKIKVDNHLFNKENLPSRFKFKEYCPMVFRNLRERFGIDDQDYQNSLTRSAPVNSENQGRFGSRFLTTYDRRFVIKTISSEDVAEMHNILKKYHQFIVECHGNTLLPQFLGMYRLTVDGVETYMVVTRNVFSHRLGVHRKYDLKGSTVSREASDKEKAKDLPTFKDNDFLNEGQKLHVGEENKKIFLEKLKRDVEFLSVLKIMDYSLLVGLHDVDRAEQEEMEVEERAEEEECEDSSGNPICSYGTPPDSPGNLLNFPRFFGPGEFDPSVDVYAMKSHDSAPKKEVYFMAIIDILTPYDAKKKAAHAAKTVKHGAGAEISTVNPEQYSKRFIEFMSNILM
uniref:Phosphatidylinositol 5-phosphate 4-kinase type-2 gamma n=1 Tax=Xenopus tropicalis TaxID=8364 RepID=A0A6I8Q7W6_XENTR